MSKTAALVLGVLLTPLSAAAVTRNVATTGVDSPTCGATALPCRSISRAIQNAVAGDRVLVRPGIYSDDLDADGVFGEPGEEPGAISVGVASLTVESTGGAAATLIRRRGGAPSNGVVLSGSGVKFGRLGKGFTLVTQGGVNSTVISVTGSPGLEVVGNVVAGPVNFGIGVAGDGALLKDNRVVCTTGNGFGFFVVLGANGRLDRNSVEGCNTGFAVAAPGYVLTRNLAIGNAVGFNLSDFGELSRSAALGNSSTGVTLNAESTTGLLFGNTFAGNGGAGANCGLYNNTGTAVSAAGNFWGAASGPGADPADQACNGIGASTTTSPFSTSDSTPTMASLR